MSNFKFDISVVFIIFNRPEKAEKVFKEIRQARPKKLFVVADGPRVDYPKDKNLVERTRSVIDRVDWPCDVFKKYSKVNLGCQCNISSGLKWVFENVNEAIILEDDCVPHPTFFRFCQELLYRYREDDRIFVISGNNFQKDRKRTDYSYYFSCFNHCWGWATWKRAWKHFDYDMNLWPIINKKEWLKGIWTNYKDYKYWKERFNSTFHGKINTWDYRWTFACWINNGLTILPNVNLVTNIGFDDDATHTKGGEIFLFIPTKSMEFPLNHPPFIMRDISADNYTQRYHFDVRLRTEIVRGFGRVIPNKFRPKLKS